MKNQAQLVVAIEMVQRAQPALGGSCRLRHLDDRGSKFVQVGAPKKTRENY
jgi:hypothetical protein